MMYSERNRLLNYGYKFLESVYRLLGIDPFIIQYQKRCGFRGTYSLDEIFRYLVIDRILYSSSKRDAASSRLLNYYGLQSEWELPDIYRVLDGFNGFFYELQAHINEKVKNLTGRQSGHRPCAWTERIVKGTSAYPDHTDGVIHE